MKYGLWYLAAVSLIAILLTVYDKVAAKAFQRHRVPEAVLLLVSVMGGSFPMLITMLLVRHKTRHRRFMVGIPAIIAVQIALTVLLAWCMEKGYLL